MDDIFVKIINRELPADIIYEDEKCIAFYDKFPAKEGHFLVVPKIKKTDITEMDDEESAYLFNVARKLGKQFCKDKDKGFRLIINTGKKAGQTIFHTHIHIIPFTKEDEKLTF